MENQLTDIFQVSNVNLLQHESSENYLLKMETSRRFPCPRCRKFQSERKSELCSRCYKIVNTLIENKTFVTS